MAEFKTDYKDEIPQNGTALYNLVDQEGGVVQENIKIERSNENEQEGDLFGALQLNEICEALNNARFMIAKGGGYVTYGNYSDWVEAGKPVFGEE